MSPDLAAPGDETIRQMVSEVLQGPEFRELSNVPWWVETFRLLRQWAAGFADWASANPGTAWAVILLMLLVLLALLAHLFYVAFGDVLLRGRRSATPGPSAPSWVILEGAAETWEKALARAAAALAQGNERLALWISHRVLLGLLDEKGLIRFAAGKTNMDYLREYAPSHPWYGTLAELTQVYERVVYGHHSAAPATAEALLRRVAACQREVDLER